MARLFVVNCTGQDRLVNYRLDFTVDDQGRRTSEKLVPYRWMNIPNRTQVMFGGDWHPLQIQEIIQQIEKTCGAVAAKDVQTAKRGMGVVKMMWREDVKIPESICKDVFAHNMGLLSDQGAARRRQLALVADRQLANLIEKTPPKLEMEFEQVEEDEDLYSGKLEEGLIVKHAPVEKPARRRRATA